MIKANFKLGTLVLQIEGEDIKDLFKQTELLSQCPSACGKCGGSDISPAYSKTREFEFFFLRCRNPACRYEFKFGQRKTDKALFPKFDQGISGWVAPHHSEQDGGTGDEEDGWDQD